VTVSIVIPVHNRAPLTKRCLDAILAEPPSAELELLVVDDASTDQTPDVLADYGERVRAIRREENGGFAAACNDGAAAAGGDLFVFLNNDTIPRAGWLDALVRDAERHPRAAVVGAKLVFPDGSVQHAGVVVGQDSHPRHLYAGFPADHPAVNRSRPFQIVTAACALIRREAFEQAGGFDTSFRNSLEDADLCLRLRALGWEVRYCHESVLEHLESVSRGKRSEETEHNRRLFHERWAGRIKPDDLDYYVEDGMLRIHYRDSYPLGVEIAPELFTMPAEGRAEARERLLEERSRQVVELLHETVRLTAHVAELELGRPGRHAPTGGRWRRALARLFRRRGAAGSLARRARRIETDIHALQADLALTANGAGEGSEFEPSAYLAYRDSADRIRAAVARAVPSGSTVLLVSKGDESLVEPEGFAVWPFPQDESGSYAGHHPAHSAEAIAQLEELRRRGAEYIVFPATALWWLDHYHEFALHLERHYRLIERDDVTCAIFGLQEISETAKVPR
jgi:GT2 family glycosyltransferase